MHKIAAINADHCLTILGQVNCTLVLAVAGKIAQYYELSNGKFSLFAILIPGYKHHTIK